MTAKFVRLVMLGLVVLAMATPALAQEAVLTGTVTDSTGGVLPGVTVVAVNEATGNSFEAVTDERGIYPHSGARRRLPDHRGALRLHAR